MYVKNIHELNPSGEGRIMTQAAMSGEEGSCHFTLTSSSLLQQHLGTLQRQNESGAAPTAYEHT